METITDTIPRVQVGQLLSVAAWLAATTGKANFDAVRGHLMKESARKAPASSEAMWTIARDVLSELSRLGYANVGPLPRKRSEVLRLAGTPCELTAAGRALGANYATKRAQAYNELLSIWFERHPYFQMFVDRVLAAPLFVPDITSIKQISSERGGVELSQLTESVLRSCEDRMLRSNVHSEKILAFKRSAQGRFLALARRNHLDLLEGKALIDIIQDTIVLPSLLEAEKLPFDAVTFQHILRASQDFLVASWTTSHPDFFGRLIFCTCALESNDNFSVGRQLRSVTHHGVAFAESRFSEALIAAYGKLAKQTSTYVSAYALRAIVCFDLRIPPQVFERCLAARIATKDVAGMKIFTELPFSPPPAGEGYVKAGFDRIGLIKLSS